MKQIGKIVATERTPTTIDEFYFWTDKKLIIKPFDVVQVKHIQNSTTFGVVEEISHITDAPSVLSGFISSDFGEVNATLNTERIGMNCVKARVVGNTDNIYTPVLDGYPVSLANETEIKQALGLTDDEIKNPLPCGYLEMYEGEDKVTIPVHFNSHFLIGPEGAHLNISGISGLAAKTSYAMFLIKAIQSKFEKEQENEKNTSVAFVILNVKGSDLLAIDEKNENLGKKQIEIYEKLLKMDTKPVNNVKYFYPYSKEIYPTTYAKTEDVKNQMKLGKAFQYKYIFDQDKNNLDLLFANVDDPTQTMESIVNYLITSSENPSSAFNGLTNWEEFQQKLKNQTLVGQGETKEITIASWRKFYRLFNKTFERNRSIFANRCESKQMRLQDAILNIKKNEIFVIDIAKLDEDTQGFVFGDVMRAIHDLKLGQTERPENDIPSKIVIFIDELNKYASKEVPKSSPILRQILDITERGRSLGIILFSAEQFKSDIHDRVKGNCATHAYGRTNVIEISKHDYQYVPNVYKSMLSRLKQGEYVIQNPIFRSLLNIKFPVPLYKQFKNG